MGETRIEQSAAHAAPASKTTEPRFGAFIAGKPVAAAGQDIPLIDPTTGARWGRAVASPDLVEDAVRAAKAALDLPAWREMDPSERGKLMWRFAALIEENAEEMARLEVMASGKIMRTTRREIARAAAWYRFFGGAADKIEGLHIDLGKSSEGRVRYEPVGVVAAITPFNGPISLGTWKLAPALAAGNTVVVKPPIEAPASTLLLAELATRAGFPAGVLNVLPGGAEIGQALAEHPDVAMVTFTGSTATAKKLGAQVTARLKRFVCEAGGKSAQIVFADADIESALLSASQNVFSNAGQSCVAASRLLVEQSIYENFIERLAARTRTLRVGNPFEDTTHIGPLASKRQKDRVAALVEGAVRDGGRILAGGGSPDLAQPWNEGFYFQPTLIVDARPGSEIWREEVFGPVVVAMPFKDEAEAIALANDSSYGLAAGLWTNDIRRAHRVSVRLQAGTVWINTFRMMHYRLPFGGYKESGLGRENGLKALHEFLNVKAVITDHAPMADAFAS